MQLTPGVVVDDRYELVAPLGGLGLNTLWRARDAEIQTREHTLEVLRATPDGAPSAALLDHLRRLRALRHPGVLALQSHGVWESHPYLVFASFEGVSLREHIASRTLSVGGLLALSEVDALFRSIAEALDAAHTAELAHGDLGPDVVGVTMRGETPSVSLVDLGLGVFVDARKHLEHSDFIAPERSPHARPERGADVFSLARVLRFMLEPKRDWSGRRLRDAPLRDDVPDAVWGVIERACAPHPRQRYQRVSELVDALSLAWKEPLRALPSPAPVEVVSAPVMSAPSRVEAPPRIESPAVPNAPAMSENPWGTDVRMRRVELPVSFRAHAVETAPMAAITARQEPEARDDATALMAPIRAATAAYSAPEGFERTEQISSQKYRAFAESNASDEATMQRAPFTSPQREVREEETVQMAPVKFEVAPTLQAPAPRVEAVTAEPAEVAKPVTRVPVALAIGAVVVLVVLALALWR